MAGHPDYAKYRVLSLSEFNNLTNEEVLFSYTIIQTDFEFTKDTKYPSIPCFVDENCTIFPLKGTALLTGAEYILALQQGCKFAIKSIHTIPFSNPEQSFITKPFETIIKIVQEKRREHPKGTIHNLMYKEIGNSIYGSVVRGISYKKKFDTKTNTTQRLNGDDLSNPLIAS